MRIVIALGGNALLRRGEPLEANIQRKNIEKAATQIAALIKAGHQVVVCHGNGPQVGLLALQSCAYKKVNTYPFDILNAETQSMIGYMLQQAIQNQLESCNVMTLVTQVEVDAQDRAFDKPEKFIGPVYDDKEAEEIQRKNSWKLKKDVGGYRRVIASPHPKKIVELSTIKTLLDNNVIPICCGGGGIPIIKKDNLIKGVEAVIDKDRTASLLAQNIQAEMLIILTDLAGIYQNYQEKNQSIIKNATVKQLRKMNFCAGTMAPKVAAACQFVSETGKSACIGALEDLLEITTHEKGTHVWQ